MVTPAWHRLVVIATCTDIERPLLEHELQSVSCMNTAYFKKYNISCRIRCCTLPHCARAIQMFTNMHACDIISCSLYIYMYTLQPQQEFSVLLCAIFFAFDRDGSGSVDAYELAAGFSLLCCGNKVPYYLSLHYTTLHTTLH
jgi:hypothetical protein